MTLEKKLEKLRKFREARSKASTEFDSEDFNSTLLTSGTTGHFAFEMHKCDRNFIALAANEAAGIAADLERALMALNEISRKDPRNVNREEAADMAVEFRVEARTAIAEICGKGE